MKILVCDRLLKGKSNSDWKEGWELYYAFNNIGIECDIAGPNCPIPETEIPKIQNDYNFIIVTENYHGNDWKWWNWEEINVPKMMWAIDTHMIDFRPILTKGNFNYIGINNSSDLNLYNGYQRFHFPYGVSKKHYNVDLAKEKKYGITFLGTMNNDRRHYCTKFNIQQLHGLGNDYVKAIQESKICFNKAMMNDIHGRHGFNINAKTLEIIAAGTFILSYYNQTFDEFMKYNENLQKMYWKNDVELEHKISYYLNNDSEREEIAKNARQFIFENHSYESRAKMLYDNLIKDHK